MFVKEKRTENQVTVYKGQEIAEDFFLPSIPQKKNEDTLDLVSKELNHLAAILHVYAGGLNFMK